MSPVAGPSKSTNQPTMEELQLVPVVSYFPDGLDFDSDDDSHYEYELAHRELVLLIIELTDTKGVCLCRVVLRTG